MDRPPDFFLSTAGEYEPLAAPRSCWSKGRLRDEIRDDYMLIDIEPSLDSQCLSLVPSDITSLVISSRHRGQTLFPISEWPSFVYVSRILDSEILASLTFSRAQVELIAWGVLFRTLQEASSHAEGLAR